MTTALLDRYRRDIADLVRIAQRDLALILDGIEEGTVARDLLRAALPDLVSVYGQASATVAADFYEELRDAERVAGRFTAQPAPLPDVGRTEALARWAVDPLFAAEPDRTTALTRAGGGLQRIVADASRHTVMGSSISDPRAAGWRRRTSSGACGLCQMLASRGAVYTERSVDFGAHDHCGCIATPAFGGDVKPTDRKPTGGRKLTPADNARARAWMAEHGY